MAVVYSRTNDTNSTGWSGYTIRSTAGTLTGGGTQVRVTFVAATTGARLKADHCSIGVLGGATQPNMTTSPPIELKFSGASGFDIAAGATITSDWANLVFTSSDSLVVDIDCNSGIAVSVRAILNGSDDYYRSASPDYNHATVTGYSLGASYAISQIEGQTPSGNVERQIRGLNRGVEVGNYH